MTDVRPMRDGEHAACESILRALPEWFGIESSLVQYVEDTRKYPTWLAYVDGRDAGFMTLRTHFPKAAEIHCIAVRPEYHRRGVGRAMIAFAEHYLAAQGVEFLQVKTMGPSKPNREYALTTAFYAGVGFVEMEECIGLWDGLPALQLVKKLERRT